MQRLQTRNKVKLSPQREATLDRPGNSVYVESIYNVYINAYFKAGHF